MKCRHCGWPLEVQFLDLGVAPPSNAYLTAERLQAAELWLPLRLMVWQSCWLMQTLDYARTDTLFTENYAYFSSFSSSRLNHSRAAQRRTPSGLWLPRIVSAIERNSVPQLVGRGRGGWGSRSPNCGSRSDRTSARSLSTSWSFAATRINVHMY